jgi:hypothetical protein
MSRVITLARPGTSLVPTPKTISRRRTPPPIAPVEVIRTGLQRRPSQALPPGERPMLVASAAPVSIDFNSSRHFMLRRVARQRNALWNAEHIGELAYAELYMANAASQVELYPAIIPRPGQEPERVEDMNTLEWAALTDIGNGFQGRLTNGFASLMHTSMYHMGVPGEFFPHATTNPQTGQNEYEILGITELEPGGSSGFRVRRLPGLVPDAIPKSDRLWRVWGKDPFMSAMAWSPVMGAEDILAEIRWLQDAGIAAGQSRVASAGILIVPAGMSFAGAVNTDDQETSFDLELLEAIRTNIQEARSAGRFAPVVIEGEGDEIEKIRFLSLFQNEMEHDFQRMQEALKRLDHAINLPSGFLLGFGDMTHWNAFVVDSAIWPHIEPTVKEVLAGWDIVYRDLLIASGMPESEAASRCIWFDPSKVIAKPDRSEAVSEGISLGILHPRVWTKVKNFDPEDCYSMFETLPEDTIRNMMVGAKVGDAGLMITGDLAQMTGRVSTAEEMLPGDVRALKSAKPTTGPKEDLPAVPGDPGPAAPAPVTPPTAAPTNTPPPAQPPAVGPAPGVTASAAPLSPRGAKIARLGDRLRDIDHTLMVRLQAMADADLHAMASKVGAKLRTTARNRGLSALGIEPIDNGQLARYLGPEKVAQLAVNPHSIVQEMTTAYAAKAKAAIAKAQLATLSVVADSTGQNSDDLEMATASTRPAWLDAAEGALASGMLAVGMKFLYSPNASDLAAPKGEASDLAAPTASIRQALTFAGGGDPSGANGTAFLLGSGPMATDAAAGGGAVSGQLGTSGDSGPRYVWNWSGADRPFGPHEDLDGTQFSTFDDPELANEDGWPDSQCYPGDHDGCGCEISVLYTDSQGSGDFSTDDDTDDGGDTSADVGQDDSDTSDDDGGDDS